VAGAKGSQPYRVHVPVGNLGASASWNPQGIALLLSVSVSVTFTVHISYIKLA